MERNQRAAGYRLDVSTDSSFGNYVSGFQDLDVGNATSEVVTDLSPNATLLLRVRAYDSSAPAASSGAIAVTTMPILSSRPDASPARSRVRR